MHLNNIKKANKTNERKRKASWNIKESRLDIKELFIIYLLGENC